MNYNHEGVIAQMVQHLAFSVCHHKAVSSSLSRGTNEFLDKSKQNQPECGLGSTNDLSWKSKMSFKKSGIYEVRMTF